MGAPLTTYEDYIAEVNQNLSALERLTDRAGSTDERLDALAKIQLEQLKILKAGLLSEPLFVTGTPPYSVRKFSLDTARTTSDPEEVNLWGNYITFYSTSGYYTGLKLALDNPTNDWVPIEYFGNPYNYPATFSKFYLSWDSQSGADMWVHIGRKAGASPGAGPPASFIGVNILGGTLDTVTNLSNLVSLTQSSFVCNQVTVGVTAVQLCSTAFSSKLGIVIKADSTNAGNIYVGGSTVTTSTGFKLEYGEGVTVEVNDINQLYAIASLAAQKLYYLGV